MSKLIFSQNGNILLHWIKANPSSWSASGSLVPPCNTTIDVWDISARKLLYRSRGYLIGMANNGKTFLARLNEEAICVVETANGNVFPLEKGLADPEEYSQLHSRFYLKSSSTGINTCDVFNEYASREVSFPDLVTNVELGPYLFAALWFDWGEGIEGAYGQAIDLLTGEVGYTFSVSRHAVYVPINYSVVHNALFIGDRFDGYNLMKGEKSSINTSVVTAIQETARRVRRKINGIGFHPDGNQLAFSLGRGMIEMWDAKKKQRVEILEG